MIEARQTYFNEVVTSDDSNEAMKRSAQAAPLQQRHIDCVTKKQLVPAFKAVATQEKGIRQAHCYRYCRAI